jgi:hypothetical protein
MARLAFEQGVSNQRARAGQTDHANASWRTEVRQEA